MKDGKKLIAELQALSPVPVEIRAHHLLVTGDGTPALKWGSYGQPVEIRVDAASTLGPYKTMYSYFGYDEPNYTYMKDGKKLIAELQALSPVPVEIRAHRSEE